ncbi:MAG TPA: hypothetical protein VE863_17225 [Pyrinomonadaceae bacterium]|jgi:hypothetical protein|nr:hypothetical protein [Pyrinomonadaceae bacterium]
MTCDQGPCVVKEYKLDLPTPPEGTSPPPEEDAIIKPIKKSERPEGTVVDSTGTTSEQAILEKLKLDFQKANQAQCKVGCKCIKNKNAKPEEGAYDVPISTTHLDPNGKIFKVNGTVKIKTTDTPGKCFVDPDLASTLQAPNTAYAVSLGIGTRQYWLLMVPGLAQLIVAVSLHVWLSPSESISLIIAAAISFVYALHIYKSIVLPSANDRKLG